MRGYENTVYIKMCKKAEEIQRIPLYPEKPRPKPLNPTEYRCFSGRLWFIEDDKVIWLPTQAQLQEIYLGAMPAGTYNKIATLAEEFHEYHEVHGYPTFATSFEELWLVFVMETLYNLKWYNGEWISSNPH